jgi:hypothetical protein
VDDPAPANVHWAVQRKTLARMIAAVSVVAGERTHGGTRSARSSTRPAASRPPPSGPGGRWAAMVSAPASSPCLDSSLRSRMIASSSSASTACGLLYGRRDRGRKAIGPSRAYRYTSCCIQYRETPYSRATSLSVRPSTVTAVGRPSPCRTSAREVPTMLCNQSPRGLRGK